MIAFFGEMRRTKACSAALRAYTCTGFISGTNHLVQALAVYFGKIEEWFDNGYVTMVRWLLLP